ncbi:hypothetical protein GALL_472860 [mine drainage metagenome]|uniref:Rhomboid family intramembrane serine protease n=1 Tax=mine drainage metagenome TaxID=410659 RepID=A0A1J5Q5A7_9ZZZZ
MKPTVLAYLRRSPGTFVYLAILTITTWVLVGSSDEVTNLLLREHSTSLEQLRIDPVKVLFRSAFWTPGYEFLAWAVLFALILAPAEYWLGTRRWASVFALGHILATLGSVTTLWFAIRYGWADKSLQGAVDVGVSYGFAAVAAVFTFRLPPRWRWPWALGTVLIGLGGLLLGQSFTDVGHMIAIGVGFACYPFTRGIAVRSRKATPIWAVESLSER